MDLMEAIKHRAPSVLSRTRQSQRKLWKSWSMPRFWRQVHNSQPWHFTIIQNKALLDRISDASKAHMLKLLEHAPRSAPRRCTPIWQIRISTSSIMRRP